MDDKTPFELIINNEKLKAEAAAKSERERLNGYLGMTPEPWDYEIEIPKWAFDKVIPANTIGMIYGAPGSGKTQIALSMADAILSGKGEWNGRPIVSGDVIIFCESPGNTKGRMKGYQGDKSHQHRLYFYDTPLFDAEQIKDLGIWLLMNGVTPAAIIFDTVSTSFDFGADGENSNSAVAKVLRALQSPLNWLDDGFIAIVHHTAKGSDQYRGASALLGNCDWTMQVTRDPDLDTPVAYLMKDKWHMNDTSPVWRGTDRWADVQATNGEFKVTVTDWEETTREAIDLAKSAVDDEEKERKLGFLENQLLDSIDEQCAETGCAVIQTENKLNLTVADKVHKIAIGTSRKEQRDHLLEFIDRHPGYIVTDVYTAKDEREVGIKIIKKQMGLVQ